MTDNVENLLLEHMKRFQAALERIERRQEEGNARLSNLESSVVLIMQHLANFSAADAAQQVSSTISPAVLIGSNADWN